MKKNNYIFGILVAQIFCMLPAAVQPKYSERQIKELQRELPKIIDNARFKYQNDSCKTDTEPCTLFKVGIIAGIPVSITLTLQKDNLDYKAAIRCPVPEIVEQFSTQNVQAAEYK